MVVRNIRVAIPTSAPADTQGLDPAAALAEAAITPDEDDGDTIPAGPRPTAQSSQAGRAIQSQVGAVARANIERGGGVDRKTAIQAKDDLEGLGYAVGDDPNDAKTKDAIKQFQKDHGLKETGELDIDTLMSLVEELQAKNNQAHPTPPRPHSSWQSGRPGGTPGVQSGPTSNQGYSSPTGNYSGAPAAQGSSTGVSNGPAPFGKVDLSTEQGKEVFRKAAKLAGLPESWADSPALKSLANAESGGIVGRVNYTYGSKDPKQVINELKNGQITAKSSATGLGQMLLQNVDRYYPNGRAGIGDPVQEAAGMMKYIKDRYGSPEVAWGNHSANPHRWQGVPRIYSAEGY